MTYIDKVIEKIKSNNRKKIVLPESEDDRVLIAASKANDIADIYLIGDEKIINESAIRLNIDLSKVTIINPSTYERTEEMVNKLYELRQAKGVTLEEARKLVLENSRYFATMLVYSGICDGEVSGACHTSADTFRSAFQICKPVNGKASAFFIMELQQKELGNDGVVLFSDCGLNQNPNAELLANIAGESAKTYEALIGGTSYVGMLSHSTYGSSKCDDTNKVVEATRLAKELYPDKNIDGEMQFDAAIIPEIAESKAKGSSTAGKVNTFVFPDLDAGNIGYKIAQRLGNANAYGPLVQGLPHPINDLSRGCPADDIVGVIAITALQANIME